MSVSLVRENLRYLRFFFHKIPSPAAPQTPPSNYKVIWDNLANKLQCMNDNELNDMQTFMWNFEGIELENVYEAIIQLEQEDVQSLEKVECWASNTLGTSYAFLQFENGSVIEP